jgi:hypothetical protein
MYRLSTQWRWGLVVCGTAWLLAGVDVSASRAQAPHGRQAVPRSASDDAAANPSSAQDASPPVRAASQPSAQEIAFFEQFVRPLLVTHCYECHSHQAKEPHGGLRLDTRAGWMLGGDSGPAIVPGKPDESLLIEAVRYSGDRVQMPPRGKLAPRDIARLEQWVRMGAPDPRDGDPGTRSGSATIDLQAARQFWSFRPLQRPAVPFVPHAPWCLTPVDRFVAATMQARGLRPAPEADRRTLLRRAMFDLLGLPPTPEEVAAFVNDPAPDAYERLVDRLLASPHYGQRWARHWLDVARFAESHGYEQDYDRPHAYHYRDFVIRALNDDMPYDQFIAWQIAGDELAPHDPWALAATGFLGAGAFPTQLTEAEFEQARYDELDDMLTTTGVAVLGLSVGCARCHDHKFDPIATRDYYRLLSHFTATIRSEIELPLGPGGAPVRVQVTSEGFPHMKHHADDRGYPHFYPQTYFLHRGDVNQKRDPADPGFLQVLSRGSDDRWHVDLPDGWTRTRFARARLARWLTDVEAGAGHLAARVIVNRLWQHHFGQGIVATPNDFGTQGARPWDPELLDFLAAELVANGWRLKPIHKLIMTSAVYRQASQADSSAARSGSDSFALAGRTPRRLEAEPLRDSMLAVAGMLDTRMYGPGTLDPAMPRRSVYFFIKRSKLIPMMVLFDWPEHLVSIGQRSQTTIAPQALALLNSPAVRQYAAGFARRLQALDDDAAVEHSYELALGRLPSPEERERAMRFLAAQAAAYREQGHADALQRARVDYCQALFCLNEFLYVD